MLEQYREIIDFLPEKQILINEPMRNHTSFKVGGPADVLICATNSFELKSIVRWAIEKGVSYTIIGNGSNLLVSDEGIRGLVIKVKSPEYVFEPVELADGRISVEVYAGASLSVFSKAAAKEGYTGTEPLAGIPGSVGGAVAMNAGAYGGEIKDIIASARVLDKAGNELVLSAEELELSYRNSRVLREGYIVLSAEFVLAKGNAEESLELISELNKKRRDKQPLEYPSAGSTFKRPEGYFAGKLIEDAGLKGFKVGDACVSEKHSGFVINLGNANAAQIYELTEEVSRIVYETFGVHLEREVRLLGDF